MKDYQDSPIQMSMRKSALTKAGCGGNLYTLYDVKRFEQSHNYSKPRRSWKSYRKTQFKEVSCFRN